ncbi:MAG: Ig-like domain-containing protein [Mariprofundaceae bacterium]|nr:Ig-like domain-containing protein [Mariprofundaceae bacterium]
MMQRGSDMWSRMVLQRWLLMLAVLFSLAACGGAVPSTPAAGGAAAAGNVATLAVSTLSTPLTLSFVGTGTNTTTPIVSQIGLRASKYKVLTNGKDSITLTATLQDTNNTAMSKIWVSFHTNHGLLTASQMQTDAYGRASVGLSSGVNISNVQADVYAVAGGVSSLILPIQITGTSLIVSGIKNNLDTAGKISDTVTITLKDAGNQAIVKKTLSVSSHGGGLRFNGTNIDPYTLTTDVTGSATLTVDAYAIATVSTKTLTVSLDANTKATRNYNATGVAFGVSVPAVDPYAMFVGKSHTITVSNVLPPNASVIFSTSLGLLNRTVTTLTTKAVGGTASVNISSALVGIATVQVSVAGSTTQVTSTRFSISQTTANASKVTLQASANVLATSVGSVNNSVQLIATVKDANGKGVGQSPVIFTMKTPVGGGENIFPVLVQTNASGVATSTFTSGSLPSGAQGVDIYATVVKTTGLPTVDPHAITNIVMGGTAGSVVIGRGSRVTSLNAATYQIMMAVVVADSNGNAVSGAQVTLKAWPSYYRFGYWQRDRGRLGSIDCQPVFIPTTLWKSTPNEDLNKNLTLDAGENKTNIMASYFVSRLTGQQVLPSDLYASKIPTAAPTPAANDGVLTPGNSAGGTLPLKPVITDVNGVATFNLTYLKADAQWVTTAITAKTLVSGTETRATIEFRLPNAIKDSSACLLPDSPFNNAAWGLKSL